jgi:4-alpha-glucanotransferase
MRMIRSSGILFHPTSLPGLFGIGDLGPEAHRFVERLAEAGQRIWQVLPLGPTGYGDSPYASFSTYAGNELLLSPELLAAEGLLDAAELAAPGPFPEDRVDYGAVITWKRPLLEKAAARFLSGADPLRRAAFEAFRKAEDHWLEDYALFMAIKGDYDDRARREGRGGARWNNYWPADLALRRPAALRAERNNRAEAMARIEVLQFLFAEEWRALKAKANGAGIMIVGDLPIFVAEDSADVWTRRGLFRLDGRGRPIEVAGVPPDYFSTDGQLWGNPLYDWKAHRREGFAWWRSRLKAALARFDALRIDHFRGFEAYWAVPAGEGTARNGTWRKAPGEALFAAIRRDLGPDMPIVAEDLGFITEEVRQLRDGFDLPGMRVLQFAFDAAESGTAFDPANGFLPHNYVERCVVYTGTHDNDTFAGWVAQASPEERAYLARYFGYDAGGAEGCGSGGRSAGAGGWPWALVREAWKSVAAWAIAPMQDILGLGSDARMNTPSTLGGNWAWRMRDGAFDAGLARRLAELSRLYGRGL